VSTLPFPSEPAALLTVSRLVRMVKGALRTALPERLIVVGELSNLSRPTSGHLYFTLKDASSEIRCVMWQSDAVGMRFAPTDGLAVLATGRIDVYEPRGQVQFYVSRLEPRGVGSLELAFRQLRDRLQREGLFDLARKRRLPAIPRTVAVVTSPTGAVLRDILQTIRRRYPAVRVLVYPVRVQGAGAAEGIAAAVRGLNANAARLGGIDVMIVGRGGGSLEDLWAFNEEAVARAIHASRIPVVSAVGHETDFTIADFVADVRAATPTAAAELVVPLLAEMIDALDRGRGRLVRASQSVLDLARSRFAAVQRSEWLRDPVGRVRQRQQQVDEVSGRVRLSAAQRLARARAALHEREVRLARVRPEVLVLRRVARLERMMFRLRWVYRQNALAAERRLGAVWGRLMACGPRWVAQRDTQTLDHARQQLIRAEAACRAGLHERVRELAARLEAVGPAQVLRRGYSITRRRRDGAVVRGPDEVRIDEQIITQTAGGEFDSRVVDEGSNDPRP